MEFNLADVFETVANTVPDNEAIVRGELRLTYAELDERANRLANVLAAAGHGAHRERDGLGGHESHQDHLAVYLYNGNEYLEAMLGAWKARAASINLNYRYTAEELADVLRDSSASAVVYHARFAPVLATALEQIPTVRLLVVVDDDSGTEPVAGSVAYEDLLAAAPADRPPLTWSPQDRYIVYTGGTTGRPKGVLWRQSDFLASALNIGDPLHDLVRRAARPDRPRSLPAPPFMHGAAHWNALGCWLGGGTVVIQSETDHLDAADVLDTCAREAVTSLLVVGDAFARPLLDELRRHPRPLGSLQFLLTGGAVLSPATKAAMLDVLPDLRIMDILGSSETGRHGVNTTTEDDRSTPGVFVPAPTTVVLDEARTRPLAPGTGASGWLAQTGAVPLGYLGDEVKTRQTFPEIDGVVHAVAGDRARLLADGRIQLLGRDSVTINTGGEKVHAEEVEQALKAHPSVHDALVVGRPSERWGQEVVAVVAPARRARSDEFDTAAVTATAAEHLARYKLPKDYVVVDAIRRSASGKPDYAWARTVATGG